MSKGHRDNHQARKKRGPEAFALKERRREPTPKCNRCGTKCRPQKLRAGLCPPCFNGNR